ncbi:MAG: DUF1998 domain-containing protein, partial [Candidatus Eremiobacterota bacterium]
NVYFANILSSIYLPRNRSHFSRKVIQILDEYWSAINSSLVNGKLNEIKIECIAELKSVSPDELLAAAEERLNNSNDNDTDLSEEAFRKAEYDAILMQAGGPKQDFYAHKIEASAYSSTINKYFKSIYLLYKIKETRAFTGFSRWLPDNDGHYSDRKKDLYLDEEINWLPAITVRGEGIFFEFDHTGIQEWSNRREVINRADILMKNYNKSLFARGRSDRILNPRFILIHTFAHMLINQFSFYCGYGSSALRERIYCNTENLSEIMNGVLIYTASGDSEGTLGGLVRQGKPGCLEDIVTSAIAHSNWCSSDPVCMESMGQGPASCNLAACHSCALLPETSCEEGNRLLDRGLVTGTLDIRNTGYFL